MAIVSSSIKQSPKVIPDPHFKECVLVSLANAKDNYPKVSDAVIKEIKDNTYYRRVKATGELKSMVSILPDKLHVAWVMCSTCGSHFMDCKCVAGIHIPVTIVYFYSKARHTEYGEPLMTTNQLYENAPKYPVGKEPGAKPKKSLDKGTKVTKPSGNPFANMQPPVRGTSRRGSATNDKRGNRLNTPIGENKGMSIKDIENIDMSKITDIAKTMADDGITSVNELVISNRKLPKKPKK